MDMACVVREKAWWIDQSWDCWERVKKEKDKYNKIYLVLKELTNELGMQVSDYALSDELEIIVEYGSLCGYDLEICVDVPYYKLINRDEAITSIKNKIREALQHCLERMSD